MTSSDFNHISLTPKHALHQVLLRDSSSLSNSGFSYNIVFVYPTGSWGMFSWVPTIQYLIMETRELGLLKLLKMLKISTCFVSLSWPTSTLSIVVSSCLCKYVSIFSITFCILKKKGSIRIFGTR